MNVTTYYRTTFELMFIVCPDADPARGKALKHVVLRHYLLLGLCQAILPMNVGSNVKIKEGDQDHAATCVKIVITMSNHFNFSPFS